MRLFAKLLIPLVFSAINVTGAAAEDSSSEVDRIYGSRPRSRMQAPSTANPLGEQKMSPEDAAKILGFQKERLQLPKDQATLGAHIAANPVFPMLGGQSPDLFYVLYWNNVALDIVSVDHTNTVFLDPAKKFYGEQFGPHRASRALAMVHLAMFEAVNTLTHEFASYTLKGQKSIQSQITDDLNANELTALLTATVQTEKLRPARVELQAAVSFAAYNMLRLLYPQKAQFIDIANEKSLATISPQDPLARSQGKNIGESAARIVFALRSKDVSPTPDDPTAKCDVPKNSLCWEPRFASLDHLDPLIFQPDDVSRSLLRLGGNWGLLTPFEASNGTLIHKKTNGVDPIIDLGSDGMLEPPAPGTSEFEAALKGEQKAHLITDPHDSKKQIESKYGVWQYGGSGVASNQTAGDLLPSDPMEGHTYATPTSREGEPNEKNKQTFEANFWGYDGTSLLCAPPRLYNMIATVYPFDRDNPHTSEVDDVTKMARYLALVNLALADSGILSWKAKYDFNRDRPVDYIRFGLPNDIVYIDRKVEPKSSDIPPVRVETTPSIGIKWTPFGQVSSNFAAPNTTPAFPSYPSGHAVFGGALFEVIRKVFQIDNDSKDKSFYFVSDEYNGKNAGADGVPRPLIEVSFSSLKGAEWENAESRVWLGIHFQFDADDGIKLGNKIARNIVDNQLKPISP